VKILFFHDENEMSIKCDKEINNLKGLAHIKKLNIQSAEGIAESAFWNVNKIPTILLIAGNSIGDAECYRWEGIIVPYQEIIDEMESWK